jgi:hypothetical protein
VSNYDYNFILTAIYSTILARGRIGLGSGRISIYGVRGDKDARFLVFGISIVLISPIFHVSGLINICSFPITILRV